MATAKVHTIFRTPLLLLAIINLAILGYILWPWPAALNLPGDGTAIDPAVSLAVYIGLAFWIGRTRGETARNALMNAASLGVLAGAVLVALVVLVSRSPVHGSVSISLQLALIAVAAVLWGVSGVRVARSGRSTGFAAVCGVWGAMVSSLIACTALLTETYFAMAPGQSTDAWKEYQSTFTGSPETLAMVHTLNAVTGFLLVGPIVGCVAAALLGAMFKPRKRSKAG